jgi:hypothetical protein
VPAYLLLYNEQNAQEQKPVNLITPSLKRLSSFFQHIRLTAIKLGKIDEEFLIFPLKSLRDRKNQDMVFA